jgi:hypothetical protein
MYKHLGVRFRQADFTYSFSLLTPAAPARGQQITTTMIYNGSSGREGISMPSALRGAWLAAEGEPWFARALAWVATYAAFALMAACMAFSYVRLLWLTLPVMRSRHLAKMTFREWSEGTVPDGLVARVVGLDGVWREFTRTVLLPLLSAVCTASEEDIMGHPVEEFLGIVPLAYLRSRISMETCCRLYLAHHGHSSLRRGEGRPRCGGAFDIQLVTFMRTSVFPIVRDSAVR